MAFLQAPAPDWSLELGRVAGQVCDELGLAVPGSSGWYVRPSAFFDDLVVTANHSPASKRDTVLAAGAVVAPLWPGWLEGSGVGCVVWLPGFSVRFGFEAMVGLAAGDLDHRQWWDVGAVTLG